MKPNSTSSRCTSGYLVAAQGEGNVVYLKWTGRADFLPGKDGKLEINDNGFWKVVSGTGNFKGLKGAGSLHIKATNPTYRFASWTASWSLASNRTDTLENFFRRERTVLPNRRLLVGED